MQYNVPQFIDVEAKIIGPISARQFIIVLATLGIDFLWYQLLPLWLFIALLAITSAIGGAIAFAKVNGQAMHYFLLNFIETLRRPSLRRWQRTSFVLKFDRPIDAASARLGMMVKQPLSGSRLAQISLVVDTGGAYVLEDLKPNTRRQHAKQTQNALPPQSIQ